MNQFPPVLHDDEGNNLVDFIELLGWGELDLRKRKKAKKSTEMSEGKMEDDLYKKLSQHLFLKGWQGEVWQADIVRKYQQTITANLSRFAASPVLDTLRMQVLANCEKTLSCSLNERDLLIRVIHSTLDEIGSFLKII